MQGTKAELDARYCIVTLMYRGRIAEAQRALDTFTANGTLSSKHRAFYQLLLDEAQKQAPTSPHGELTPDEALRLAAKLNRE